MSSSSTGTDVGRGDYGVYNADTGIATLLGNVAITRGKDVISGQYAVMDLNNNISRMLPAPSRPAAAPTARRRASFVRQDKRPARGRNTARRRRKPPDAADGGLAKTP